MAASPRQTVHKDQAGPASDWSAADVQKQEDKQQERGHSDAIRSALKKEARRVSVVEDYAAELDEIASLQKKTRCLAGEIRSLEEGLSLR